MSEAMDGWYQAVISGIATAATLSGTTSRFCGNLSISRSTPGRLNEAVLLLQRFYDALQCFSEVLAIIQPRHTQLQEATSTLETVTEQMRVFVHVLLFYEKVIQNIVNNIKRNSVAGIIRFKLTGQHEICELQMAIRHMRTHIVNAYNQLTASAAHQETQYNQVLDADGYSMTQRRATSQSSPAELESSSRSKPPNSHEIGSQAYTVNPRVFGDRPAEMEGSAVPLQVNRKEFNSSTLPDRKQEFAFASSRSEVTLTCQGPMCDRSDLRAESIKSVPDLCTSKCHLDQHRNILAPPTWVLQDLPDAVAHTQSLPNTTFSVGPPGWIDPITSYCILAYKQFTCNICGCFLECCYTTYRALVESHSQYFWYLQFYFGRILINIKLLLRAFRAIFNSSQTATGIQIILVYVFTDCLLLARDPISPIQSLLQLLGHVDTIQTPNPTHVQPFARVHFSSIAQMRLMQARKILITTKRTTTSEVVSFVLAPTDADSHKSLVRMILSWLEDAAQTHDK